MTGVVGRSKKAYDGFNGFRFYEWQFKFAYHKSVVPSFGESYFVREVDVIDEWVMGVDVELEAMVARSDEELCETSPLPCEVYAVGGWHKTL